MSLPLSCPAFADEVVTRLRQHLAQEQARSAASTVAEDPDDALDADLDFSVFETVPQSPLDALAARHRARKAPATRATAAASDATVDTAAKTTPPAVVGEIRRLLRTPEVAARVSRTQRKDRPDLGEADISASLTQFDEMWKALIPAEQARVVRLLVARVTASDAGLAVDLRHEGLGAIAALMAPAKPEVA